AIVVSGQDAKHLAAPAVHANVGAKAVHDVDGLCLSKFPRPGCEGIRLRSQRADRAQVDNIARKLGLHALLEVGADLHIFAAADSAKFGNARNFGHKADAARTLDAARHERLYQRPEIFLFHGALVFAVAAAVEAIIHGLILKIALASLVADRAIERV